MLILAAAAMAMMAADAPRMPAPAAPSARTGYPKLSRCASPIAQPADQPQYSPACREWRAAELQRISALPTAERIERVADLRERMGLSDDEGLSTTPAGTLVPAHQDFVAR